MPYFVASEPPDIVQAIVLCETNLQVVLYFRILIYRSSVKKLLFLALQSGLLVLMIL